MCLRIQCIQRYMYGFVVDNKEKKKKARKTKAGYLNNRKVATFIRIVLKCYVNMCVVVVIICV